jgi:hypothetical protein
LFIEIVVFLMIDNALPRRCVKGNGFEASVLAFSLFAVELFNHPGSRIHGASCARVTLRLQQDKA